MGCALTIMAMTFLKKPEETPAPSGSPAVPPIENQELEPENLTEGSPQDKARIEELEKELNKAQETLNFANNEHRTAQEKGAMEIDKLKNERDLFKKDSFEARLEIQNMMKEVEASKLAHKILFAEHRTLQDQMKAMEKAGRQSIEDNRVVVENLQKGREELQEQYRKTLEDCEKQKQDCDRVRKEFGEYRERILKEQQELDHKYRDLGFHKVAYDQLKEECDALRKQQAEAYEVHANNEKKIDELKRKLEYSQQAIAANEKSMEQTHQLGELLEKQLAQQKNRSAEYLGLKEENKMLKDQIARLKEQIEKLSTPPPQQEQG